MQNEIEKVNPAHTFTAYQPSTPEQEKVLHAMQAIADELVLNAREFERATSPLKYGALWILSGATGLGKTHLMESIVNAVSRQSPDLLSQIYLARGNFVGNCLLGVADYTFDKKKIILMDDVFAEYGSVDQFKSTDATALANIITYLYESRTLCVMTSNFAFKDVLLPLIQKYDPVGRAVSRARDLLSNAAELVLTGEDYRLIRAAARDAEALSENRPFTISRVDEGAPIRPSGSGEKPRGKGCRIDGTC